MSNIVDFTSFKNKKDTLDLLKRGAINLYPQIEDIIDTEIARIAETKDVFAYIKNSPEVNLSIVTSLCFALSIFLAKLISKPNDFNLTRDNMDDYIRDLLSSMLYENMKEKVQI